ncbi:MAG: DUF885 domain-containing protein [Candidatus Sericytochromatia bacterium]
MPDSPLQSLADEILTFCWQSHPVQATDLGVHDYDHHYADYSPEGRQQVRQQSHDFLQRLDALDLNSLSLEQQVDHALLRSYLSTHLYDEEHLHLLTTQPSLYPSEALLGVQKLQINYSLPTDHRVLAIIGRLKNMPRLLEQGIQNLRASSDTISRISIVQALDSVHNGKQFLEEILPPFSATVPHYFKELLDSNTLALKAMHHFEEFLHELEPKASDEFACGQDYFEYLLRERHHVDYSLEDIVAFGTASLEHTEKLLHEVAEELDPGTPWQTQIERLKNQHPPAAELLPYYKEETERVRDFGIAHNLYTLPETETLAIMETPIFQRGIMPYSGYVSPAPFEDHQTGYFWVTPMSDSMDAEEQHQRLRVHNPYDVVLTTVHHAYPGQHLLFVRANQHPSRVRRSFPDLFFAEGWPMYCEEMLYTEGLYTDLSTRLFQLKDQLWRDCRLILDARLHMGQIGYDEAVQMLVDKIGFDRASAEGEIKRYILFPTMASGFMLGKREIVRLRQEIADLQGDDFSLKHFHDTLLSFGIVPLSLLRRLVLDHYGVQAD